MIIKSNISIKPHAKVPNNPANVNNDANVNWLNAGSNTITTETANYNNAGNKNANVNVNVEYANDYNANVKVSEYFLLIFLN